MLESIPSVVRRLKDLGYDSLGSFIFALFFGKGVDSAFLCSYSFISIHM